MKFLVNWVKSAQQMGESTIEGTDTFLENGSLVIHTKTYEEGEKTRFTSVINAIYAPGCWSSIVEVKDELAPKMCRPADSDVYVEHPDNANLAPLPEDPVEFKGVDRNTLEREMADLE